MMIIISYLERVVAHLTDPYEMAIVTHALTLANSQAKEAAFNRLHSLRTENGTVSSLFH